MLILLLSQIHPLLTSICFPVVVVSPSSETKLTAQSWTLTFFLVIPVHAATGRMQEEHICHQNIVLPFV